MISCEEVAIDTTIISEKEERLAKVTQAIEEAKLEHIAMASAEEHEEKLSLTKTHLQESEILLETLQEQLTEHGNSEQEISNAIEQHHSSLSQITAEITSMEAYKKEIESKEEEDL